VTIGGILWWVALSLAAGGWAAVALAGLVTRLSLPRLDRIDLSDRGEEGWPTLSIVVAAKDEESGIEEATRSLLALDYPGLEIVAVEDRSSDRTGEILDRLAAGDSRLTVVHVGSLPPGWLGKNHACREGAARARGEWLLFTDGDVVFESDVLRRAVAFAERSALGHVAAFPDFVAPGFLEKAFVCGAGLWLLFLFRPWDLRRAGTSAYVGVGAFNLVRRDAYERVGGHERLRFELVDDAKLGMLLRRSGVRQGAIDGTGKIRVRWNAGFLASVGGLFKNAFAGMEWSLALAVAFVSVLFVLTLPPLVGLFAAPGALLRGLALVSILSAAFLHGIAARLRAGGSGLEGLAWPLAQGGMIVLAVGSPLLAILRRGIRWRGTFYSLRELEAGCVRERDFPTSGSPGW
jgi:hypothetical protein